MTRLEDFLVEVSFTQLMNEKMARRIGFNARTWNKALENNLVEQDLSGYFYLTSWGRMMVREAARKLLARR
jgi:hypothetical protein